MAAEQTIPADAAAAAKTKTKARSKAKTKTRRRSAKQAEEKTERLTLTGAPLIFALDIGTRSVIGIVAEQTADGLRIVATERQEHKTRAMLDGQIHDVPQVASIIKSVKEALEKKTGPLKTAAVAAAGRALYTMTAEAELEISGVITSEQERRLDFAGVQAAQTKLSSSDIDDPTSYYCVGYSTIKYLLDGIQLKTLVGQRGRTAKATVIATFLPRQVIDSMHSALREAGLEMQALTLEPIAAINVLIPPTMRHLNLVLVDIGAGTSDVAITKNGSVIAYGMVPLAGDEITEAISHKYLLDFNVAEQVKRDAADGKDSHFSDILGMPYDLTASEVIEPVMPSIQNLAGSIARQIIELNGSEPQAVLLVGGGSLTPHLAKLTADALSLPQPRVAVRRPEAVDGMTAIPKALHSPEAVTPLGILKIASINTLHFLSVFVNDEEYSLFNFRDLTVSDALLNAGIQLKKFNGHPGLGLMLNINGQPKFIPGTMGTLAQLTLDGQEASLDTPIADGCHITIHPGQDGSTPVVTLGEVIDIADATTVYINGRERVLPPQYLINDEPAGLTRRLSDGDVITARQTASLGETLKAVGYPPQGSKLTYTLNGSPTSVTRVPKLLINDTPATISATVHDRDHIEYIPASEPKLGDILDISEIDAYNVIYFNKTEHKIPSATISLTVNGRPATTNTIISEGCSVTYKRSDRAATLVSAALLAVGFEPPAASSRVKVTIKVNGKEAEFTDPIKNGDSLDVEITPIDTPPAPEPPAEQKPLRDSLLGPELKDSLLGKNS